MRIIIAAIISCMMLVLPLPVNAATPKDKEITRLRKLVIALRENVQAKNTIIVERNKTIYDLGLTIESNKRDIATLKSDNAKLTTDLAAMTTLRDQALLGLPDAILAAPTVSFRDLVLIPAYNAHKTCRSFYTSGGYWSYTFDNMC